MKCRRNIFLICLVLISSPTFPACLTVVTPTEETCTSTEYYSENRTETYLEKSAQATVMSGEDIITPCVAWSNGALKFKGHQRVWYYGYDLSLLQPHDREGLKIYLSQQQFYEYTILRVFDMTFVGHILPPPQISVTDAIPPSGIKREILTMGGDTSSLDNWLNLANVKLNRALFLGGKSDLWLNRETPQILELNIHDGRQVAIVISGPSVPQNVRFNTVRTWSDINNVYMEQTATRVTTYQLEKPVMRHLSVLQFRQVPFWEALLNR